MFNGQVKMTGPTLENKIGKNVEWKPDENDFLIAKQKECLKKKGSG